MININKKPVIFIVLLVQAFAAIFCGFLALKIISAKKPIPRVYIEDTLLKNNDKNSFLKAAKLKYENLLNNGFLTISLEDSSHYKIKYSDFKASLDYDSMYSQIEAEQSNPFKALISSYFFSNDLTITPVVKFNEDLLGEKLKDLSYEIYKKPLNVDIILNNNKIEVIPEKNGFKLNILNSIKKLKTDIPLHLNSPIQFSSLNNFEIELIPPQFTREHLSEIKKILSQTTVDVNSKEDQASASLAANAINKVIIPKNKDFSFNKYLNLSNLIMQKNNDGYNMIASALYSAALSAGINSDNIIKAQNTQKTDYIDNKKAIVVKGTSQDFLFKNTLKSSIMLYSQINGNKITVYILGS